MNLRVVGGLVFVGVGFAGCTAGSGPLVTYTQTGRDDPGSMGDSPPDVRDKTAGNCIVCDVNYACSGTGKSSALGNGTFELSTSGGSCLPALVTLVCSGALFNASGCTGGGGASFTCGDTTCSPTGTTGNSAPGVAMTVSAPGTSAGAGSRPAPATECTAACTSNADCASTCGTGTWCCDIPSATCMESSSVSCPAAVAGSSSGSSGLGTTGSLPPGPVDAG